jgi:hypothetical protein
MKTKFIAKKSEFDTTKIKRGACKTELKMGQRKHRCRLGYYK